MSFILDQMKKAGKQRALEMAMRRKTEQPGEIKAEPLSVRSIEPTPVFAHKWQIAAIAVLLGFVVLYGVMYLSGAHIVQQPVAPAAKGLVQEASPLRSMPLSGPPVKITGAHDQKQIMPGAKSSAAEEKQTATVKAPGPMADSYRGGISPDQADADRRLDEKGKQSPAVLMDALPGAGPSDPLLAGSVLEFNQLPQAVRKSLPEIRITSHLYRKDSRLVSINGRIMSEGFNMDDGLYLEEITPEGVILSFGKHRFLVRAAK